MDPIDLIRSNYCFAVVKQCYERKCKLRLDGFSKYVILKAEGICHTREMCDCIIFVANDGIIVAVVELKSKTVHASEVCKKLINSSQIALQILERCSNSQINVDDFYPMVLSKRWNTPEFKTITKHKVDIRGKKCSIIPRRCGSFFSEVISALQ